MKKLIFFILKVTEDPDPFIRGTDPRFRIHIRIRTKMSWIWNTAIIGTRWNFFAYRIRPTALWYLRISATGAKDSGTYLFIISSFRNSSDKLRSLFNDNDCFLLYLVIVGTLTTMRRKGRFSSLFRWLVKWASIVRWDFLPSYHPIVCRFRISNFVGFDPDICGDRRKFVFFAVYSSYALIFIRRFLLISLLSLCAVS